jgi:serine-type D-Ala-D-Ala carboxypeptidase (penicillin-binding protein 5/6)
LKDLMRVPAIHRRILTAVIAFLLLFQIIPLTAEATVGHTPQIVAPRAILMDAETGAVLYDKNAHGITFPASTTKVLTALLVLEKAALTDVVHIDYEPGVTGSSMYILPGESFTVETLLRALLIRSANDAAEVLGRHIAGSVEAFVDLMNQRAAQLGAVHTHFMNPHGLPHEAHVTTAYDLALISREAMKYELFREIVASPALIIPETGHTEQRVYNNSNRFLWGAGPRHQMMYQGQSTNIAYDPVDGIKTGYTNSARNCLISSALFNDQRFIAVVLNAEQENVYSDSRTLLDYGFQFFHHLTLVEEGMMTGSVPVINGTADSVSLYAAQTIRHVFPRNVLPDDIRREIHLPDENVPAPVENGAALGWIDYYYADEFLGQVKLITHETIDFVPQYMRISPFAYGSVGFLALFLFWQGQVYRLRRKRQKIRRRRAERYRQTESTE